jgi:hypothetical protein
MKYIGILLTAISLSLFALSGLWWALIPAALFVAIKVGKAVIFHILITTGEDLHK